MTASATAPEMTYSGYCSSRVNSACGVSPSSTTGFVRMPGLSRSTSTAVRPKAANQMMTKMDGRAMVPPMNWRTVRPREMRAKNMPTNGDQQMVHAQ